MSEDTKNISEAPQSDPYSSNNMADTLFRLVNDLCHIFFVHEEMIKLRSGTLCYSHIWLNEVIMCTKIMHRELKFQIRGHNITSGNKVIPVGGFYEVTECVLPFHLAMIKSAEMAKNVLCIFECNYINLLIDDSNVRRYFDVLYALGAILKECERYMQLMEDDPVEDDFESVYSGIMETSADSESEDRVW